MSDWIGLAFFVLLIIGVFVGLKVLANPKVRTAEEFERNAAENTTMLGVGMNILNGFLNPGATKSKEVQTQLKEGRFNKKKREGKANADDEGQFSGVE